MRSAGPLTLSQPTSHSTSRNRLLPSPVFVQLLKGGELAQLSANTLDVHALFDGKGDALLARGPRHTGSTGHKWTAVRI